MAIANGNPHPPLLPQHTQMLTASAIMPEIAKVRGYWSATKKSELKALGFSDAQCLVPAFVVPVFGVTGEVVLHQIRPDNPRAGFPPSRCPGT